MKITTTFCSLLLAGTLFSQANDSIVTARTENHLRVQGTSVYVILPSDYIPADAFSGFDSAARNARLRIEQSQSLGFDQRLAELDGLLKRGGLKIVEYRDLVFNGYPAKFIRTEAADVLGSTILLFGDTHFYIQLGGSYRLSDKPAANTMRTATLMSVYEKTNE